MMIAMAYAYLVLSGLISLQGVWCAPADTNTVTLGTKLSDDFNKNLALVLSNIQNGATAVARPPIKFGVETVPSVITHGITTAADKAAKLANANQEAFGNIVTGASHALGSGAVLGSSIAGGAMTVAGHSLEAANNVVETGAKIGVDLAGKVGDHAAGAAQLAGTIANTALTGLGDGMIVAGSGVDLLSKNMANVIDAIGGRLTLQLSAAKDMLANLMDSGAVQVSNGALTFTSTAQANYYNIMNSYLQILMSVQKLFDSFVASIGSVGLTAGINPNTITATTGTATTTAGSTSETKTGAAGAASAQTSGAASGSGLLKASAGAGVGIGRTGASQKSY